MAVRDSALNPYLELKFNDRNTTLLLAAMFALSAAVLGLSGCSTITEREEFMANNARTVASREGSGNIVFTPSPRDRRVTGLALVNPD